MKTGIGIVGCGVISDIYLKNLSTVFENTRVISVFDLNQEAAQKKAAQYGVRAAATYEEMLADPEVEVVLNITTPLAHFALTKAALEAVKHVYSEKPLALTYAECSGLEATAKAHGVLLGCAPDTFLGATYQKAQEIVESGELGEITSVYSFAVCHGHEHWHPAPGFFYDVGAGPMLDRGPYNLSTLVAMLGPVEWVAGMTGKAFTERTIGCGPDLGKTVPVNVPTHVNGLMQFCSGALCVISTSFDVWGSQLPAAEIHGTKGSMKLPIPINFDGEIGLRIGRVKEYTPVPLEGPYDRNSRGLGLSDMVRCIQKGGTYRCTSALATHCVEVMEAFDRSQAEKGFIHIESRCDRPALLQKGLTFGQVGE